MRIGVLGGGITGLMVAHHLLQAGQEITLLEESEQVGGLASTIRVEDQCIERFYHHLFKSDQDIVTLLNQVGLGDRLSWRESRIGYFHKDRIYKFGKPLDLLSFDPLSWSGKIAFGLSVLYLQKKSNWNGLNHTSVKQWYSRFGAHEVYRQVWEPLLKLKFGTEYENISAAWLWGRIHPRANSRERFYENERLGYVRGSFGLLFEKLKNQMVDHGVAFRNGVRVMNVEPLGDGRIRVHHGSGSDIFDKVIVTFHNPTFLKIAPALSQDYREKIEKIRYNSIVCMLFVLKRSILDKIYWLNVHNEDLPFGGVIEHTNFVPVSEYNGRHLVYVFNYIPPDDPMFVSEKSLIESKYVAGLKRISPSFREDWIERTILSRAHYASPVYTIDYSKWIPSYETPISNLYLVNTSQVYPEDRNLNNCMRNARKLSQCVLTSLN